MLKLITGFIVLFFNITAFAQLDCSKFPLHQSTVAKCIFRTIVEKGIPTNHPLVNELHSQAQELQNKGLINSKEYRALFVGGENDALTYIVSVDFYAVQNGKTIFKSVTAVMTAYTQGNAEIKKIFSQDEIGDWLDQ